MNEYPYLENIVFIWGRTIAPPAFLIWLFILWRQGNLKTQTIGKFFFSFFIFVLATALAKSWVQYSIWASDVKTKFLLPPYERTYFYNYAFFRFFLEHAIALAMAALLGGFLFLLYKYSHGEMLTKSEVFLGAFLAFLVGWPAVTLFVPGVFLSMAGWQVAALALARFYPKAGVKRKLALSPFLFATAFVLVFASDQLIKFFQLSVFKVTT